MVRREPEPRETLRQLIDNAGMSMAKLAKKARIDPKTLRGMRDGLWDTPRVESVARLAKVLGLEPTRVRAACEASRAAAEKR